MANVVGERYQITIDKKVRRQLGVKPGDLAVERVEDGRLVIEFAPKPHRTSLYGALHQPGMKPITDWQAVKDEAWAARSAEVIEVLEADSRRHHEADGPRPGEADGRRPGEAFGQVDPYRDVERPDRDQP